MNPASASQPTPPLRQHRAEQSPLHSAHDSDIQPGHALDRPQPLPGRCTRQPRVCRSFQQQHVSAYQPPIDALIPLSQAAVIPPSTMEWVGISNTMVVSQAFAACRPTAPSLSPHRLHEFPEMLQQVDLCEYPILAPNTHEIRPARRPTRSASQASVYRSPSPSPS